MIMIAEKSLAVYKNKAALIKGKESDKIIIAIPGEEHIKVREKDIDIIHCGPVTNFDCLNDARLLYKASAVRECWELLLEDKRAKTSLKEIAELSFSEDSPASAWAAYCLLIDGLYYTGTLGDITVRPQEEVCAEEKRRENKNREYEEKELFLKRLRERRLLLLPVNEKMQNDDRRFIQDIEALAYGKSEKSRTLKDLNLGETPENAHSLLLECGVWSNHINPYPSRLGISLTQPKNTPAPPPQEDRRDLTQLAAYAIDSPWSSDPDDAISLDHVNGMPVLFVHIADPAASIAIDDPAEKEACGRGATLYLPEGIFRLLAEDALPMFALGYSNSETPGRHEVSATLHVSPALTFKITLNPNCEIAETEIFPSWVKIKRLTYEEADRLIDGNESNTVLRDLCSIAEKNISRRTESGAVNIALPETHISITEGQILINPIAHFRSADMVRECMLLAGEGAGAFAARHNVPVPFILQEKGDMPKDILPGLAGACQIRRCMRPRSVSLKPGKHSGLGLYAYTQVTSPLRRYTDLISHIQIRRFLRGEKPLPADEISDRIFAGEAAANALTQAERMSRAHWTIVFLSDKKDSEWEAVAIGKIKNQWAAIIPALALETQVSLKNDVQPNDKIQLVLKSVNISQCEAVFLEKR